jgi:hypothetical protein
MPQTLLAEPRVVRPAPTPGRDPRERFRIVNEGRAGIVVLLRMLGDHHREGDEVAAHAIVFVAHCRGARPSPCSSYQQTQTDGDGLYSFVAAIGQAKIMKVVIGRRVE